VIIPFPVVTAIKALTKKRPICCTGSIGSTEFHISRTDINIYAFEVSGS
jgi:hypothetical protein